MNETEIAKKILGLIAEARQYSNPFNAGQLFRISEELMGLMVYLIKPLLEAETAYRKLVVNSIDLGNSTAKAEAEAKASGEYARWRGLERVYKQGEEEIRMVKKFAGLLSDELKRI